MVQFVSYLFMPGIPVKTLSAERAAVLPGRGSHSNKAVKHCSTVLMYSSWTSSAVNISQPADWLWRWCPVWRCLGVTFGERNVIMLHNVSWCHLTARELWIQDVWDKEVWDVCVCVSFSRSIAECVQNVSVCYCIWQRMAVFRFIQ